MELATENFVKIAIFEVEHWERQAFAALQDEHELVFSEGRLRRDALGEAADADVVSTFIYSTLDRQVLEQLTQLRFIATRSTGVDHIDIGYCTERGIRVANVPVYGEATVAEHVFALLGAISHNLVDAVDRTRRGDFSQQGLQGFDLFGKVFGLIGAGSIGRHAARIARGYGMEVIAFDLEPNVEAAKELGIRYVGFDDLLAEADIISLHVPGNSMTDNLLSDAAFDKMKDGVVLINTARGQVVDVKALLRALASGKVRAAGLDVLPEEPALREEAELLRTSFPKEHNLENLLANHILLRMSNVIITPHSAFNTREAVQRILDTTRLNIIGFANGQPENVVNPAA
jgi:D-lactate dehydrogenase